MNMLYVPLLAVLFAITGMFAFGIAMNRHYQQLTGEYETPTTIRLGMRGLGTLLLAASLSCCVNQWGPTVGVAACCGILAIGVLMTALLFSYVPSRK